MNGTCLRGYCADISYYELVQIFGEPDEGFDKSDAEWVVENDNGEIATIYNYKTGRNWNGTAGMDVEIMHDAHWHIGGTKDEIADELNEFLRAWVEENGEKGWEQ